MAQKIVPPIVNTTLLHIYMKPTLDRFVSYFHVDIDKIQECLERIGGNDTYHKEGNVWIHTQLVVNHAIYAWGQDSPMLLVALFHDIGKAYTGVEDKDGCWNYPNHGPEGAIRLGEYLSENDPHFKMVQWFMRYHMKPLYTVERKKLEKLLDTVPDDEMAKEYCTVENLLTFSICDVQASFTKLKVEYEQIALLRYLERMKKEI